MTSISPPALRKLRHLDRSSSGFRSQLSEVLDWDEYRRCVPNLQRNDLTWLVDYLDKVRRHAVLRHPPLKPV